MDHYPIFASIHENDAQNFFIRGHFGSSHFLFERARCFFSFTNSFGFVLSKCLQPSFAVSQLFSWLFLSDGTNVLISSALASSSHSSSLNGSGSDLAGMGTRPGNTTDEKLDAFLSQFAQFKKQTAQILPKMNEQEVPSYFGSHSNNTTKGLRSGTIIFGKNPTCQPATNLSEFIAKQVLCRPDSYLKRAKCQDFVARFKDDGIPYEINSPFSFAKTTITVR